VVAQANRPRFGVADVVRAHGAAYLRARGLALTREQARALDDIVRCRTAALGGHVEEYACGHDVVAYNSCRNRSCPKCVGHKAREWVEQKEKDLLPVPYFHVVFTLPRALADGIPPVARAALHEALFRAASATLLEVGRRRLGGELGFLAILHTWGQTLTHHPHVHCVVAGGALSQDRARWTSTMPRFFLPVRVLSQVFRGKMLAELRRRELPEVDAATREHLIDAAAEKKWVVYAKPPFGGPAQVLRYLARYTHRVAISDHRIADVDSEGVTFGYKDYKRQNTTRTMKLAGAEWLSRFVVHILPRGFTRIRSYGFLANTKKQEKLAAIRELIGTVAAEPAFADGDVGEGGDLGVRSCICPVCGAGVLVGRRDLPPPRCDDTS
jgi:hypothetical protein